MLGKSSTVQKREGVRPSLAASSDKIGEEFHTQIPKFISARTGATQFQRFSEQELRAITMHPRATKETLHDVYAELKHRIARHKRRVMRKRRSKRLLTIAFLLVLMMFISILTFCR